MLRGNKRLETVSGFSSEEISCMSVLDFFQRTGQETRRRAYAAGLFRQVKPRSKVPLVTKGIGEARSRICFFGKRVTFQGKPCLAGLGFDITERKRNEEALAFKNALLESASRDDN